MTYLHGSDQRDASWHKTTLIKNIRIQFYLALFLFAWGMFTAARMPQRFYDYVVRCSSMSLAFFLCLHAFAGRKKLGDIERGICIVLFVLLVILTPLFIIAAAQVRTFADR